MAPKVVGGFRQKRLHQQQLPQLSSETNNGRDGSPSHRRRWTMAAMATIPPPIVGGDRRGRQRVPQLLAETDGGNPKCVLARTATARVTTAPPVVGGVGQQQRRLPSHGQRLPQSLAESFAEMDKIGDGSPSHRRRLQQSSAESDESGYVNNSSPSCWRRRTTAEMGPPVIGRDGRR
jgi:hypothetical protein